MKFIEIENCACVVCKRVYGVCVCVCVCAYVSFCGGDTGKSS